MSLIALITITLLIIMGLFHFYWALGGKVGLDKVIPKIDNEALFKPGKIITIFVGLVLLNFSFVAYKLYFCSEDSDLIVIFGWIISAVFTFRAVGDFKTLGFFKKIKSTEFAKYDTKFFSPLCLFLGVSFAFLSLN